MGDGFQRGMWGNGSHGDPGPDVLLPAAAADALLDGHIALLSGEFRPLADTVAALSGPPSEAELRGEARARAAYRAVRPGALHDPGAPSHRQTLPLELRAASRRRRRRRAGRPRHRSTGSARPPGRRGMDGWLALVSGAAAAVIAAAVGFAYAGGAFSTHVTSLNSAAPPSSAHPSASPSGGAGVAGISAAHAPKDKPAATAAGASNAPADTPQASCEAWQKNPWRPGVKNWDHEDFDKLSMLAGSPQMVLFYCWTKLPRDYWGVAPVFHYPPGYSNGHWAWTPGSKPPAQGNGPSQGSGDSSAGSGGSPGGSSQYRH